MTMMITMTMTRMVKMMTDEMNCSIIVVVVI